MNQMGFQPELVTPNIHKFNIWPWLHVNIPVVIHPPLSWCILAREHPRCRPRPRHPQLGGIQRLRHATLVVTWGHGAPQIRKGIGQRRAMPEFHDVQRPRDMATKNDRGTWVEISSPSEKYVLYACQIRVDSSSPQRISGVKIENMDDNHHQIRS